MKLTYTQVGDYLIPDLIIPEEKRPIGRFGALHRDYIREHRSYIYNSLVLSCELWTYLADLNEQAMNRYEVMVEQFKESENVTEDLKEHDQMAWVRAMNSIRNRVDEIILNEMIYV
ncbi:MAG TPA: TnpV protein [Saccharofermentans sp.]|nr:TnpV protein [Saccharofermentans sp.]